MIETKELEEEKKYLRKTIDVLHSEIDLFSSEVKNLSDNVQELMGYAWDKTNRLSDTEFVSLANIQKRSIYAENSNKKLKCFNQMLDNTYFARIDFTDGETNENLKIYIGISSLSKDGKFYVFDWRAPISSMFYNYETGKASYQISSNEKISGELTLKRQFRISGGEIVEVFDTDNQIIDSVLKKILSGNASDKMKNIVATIQKEQNEIIRKNNSDLFIINGPAGSGKTSIAMHKIAYLLYAERDKINNSNIMIISPNEIFNNYISDVLPGIGEDNVAESTFFEFAKKYITEFHIVTKIEDIYEVVYSSKNCRNNDKYNEIKFKYDPIYLSVIQKFIKANILWLTGIDEIKIENNVIVSKNEIKKVAKSLLSNDISIYLIGKKIIERIYFIAQTRTKKHLTLEKMKKEALENLKKIKFKSSGLYKRLYSDKDGFVKFVKSVFDECGRNAEEYDLESIFDETTKYILDNKIEFQDTIPYIYMKTKIIGISPLKNIKYVLIDEAQDYSPVQYLIIANLFRNANMTILGDLNQSILPFVNYKDYSEIISAIKKYKPTCDPVNFSLTKTYRSTCEINTFAKRVIQDGNNYSQVDRHGDEVSVIKQTIFNPEEIIKNAIELKKDYNTVAIICKNNEEIKLFERIIPNSDDGKKFRIVTKHDNVFVEDKIMIIPSYLSKGLEFDAVIVSNASDEYYSDSEEKLLYVVLTRALHKLEVYHSGELTKLIK